MRRALQLARLAIVLGIFSLVLAVVSIVIAIDEYQNGEPSHWGWVRCVPVEIQFGDIAIGVCTNNAGTFWVNGQRVGRWNGPTDQLCFAIDTRSSGLWNVDPRSVCK